MHHAPRPGTQHLTPPSPSPFPPHPHPDPHPHYLPVSIMSMHIEQETNRVLDMDDPDKCTYEMGYRTAVLILNLSVFCGGGGVVGGVWAGDDPRARDGRP